MTGGLALIIMSARWAGVPRQATPPVGGSEIVLLLDPPLLDPPPASRVGSRALFVDVVAISHLRAKLRVASQTCGFSSLWCVCVTSALRCVCVTQTKQVRSGRTETMLWSFLANSSSESEASSTESSSDTSITNDCGTTR